MLYDHLFDEIACVPNGIAFTHPALVARVRQQARQLVNSEIAAHLANAIANATDAAHALAWEESQFDEARADTFADHEYFTEQVAAWNLIAVEHGVTSLEIALH